MFDWAEKYIICNEYLFQPFHLNLAESVVIINVLVIVSRYIIWYFLRVDECVK